MLSKETAGPSPHCPRDLCPAGPPADTRFSLQAPGVNAIEINARTKDPNTRTSYLCLPSCCCHTRTIQWQGPDRKTTRQHPAQEGNGNGNGNGRDEAALITAIVRCCWQARGKPLLGVGGRWGWGLVGVLSPEIAPSCPAWLPAPSSRVLPATLLPGHPAVRRGWALLVAPHLFQDTAPARPLVLRPEGGFKPTLVHVPTSA